MTVTNVLRWNGFERIIEEERISHLRIEVAIGREICNAGFFVLWPFQFKEIDGAGRYIYEAETDPYQGIVEQYERLQLDKERIRA